MPFSLINSLKKIKKIKFNSKLNKVDAVILYKNDKELIRKWILNPIGIQEVFVRDPLELFFDYRIPTYFVKNIKYLFGVNKLRRARFIYEKCLFYNKLLIILVINISKFIIRFRK